MLTPWRMFGLVTALTAAALVAQMAWEQHKRPRETRREVFNRAEGGVPLSGLPLATGVTVRDQLRAADLPAISSAGTRTIIALRPDGEEIGQPTAQALSSAAAQLGIRFVYLPTPADKIPDQIADDLARLLAAAEPGVLLYCGSGWRAARTWALAEATRPGGADAASIVQAVRKARHDIDDLKPRIDARIANRKGAG